MTISNENDLICLKEVGRIVANALEAMGKALEPGMTTADSTGSGESSLRPLERVRRRNWPMPFLARPASA
ncbi:methionine aminopeptidase [Bradyrhizobium japonicum]